MKIVFFFVFSKAMEKFWVFSLFEQYKQISVKIDSIFNCFKKHKVKKINFNISSLFLGFNLSNRELCSSLLMICLVPCHSVAFLNHHFHSQYVYET